jgi:hypothetical protein
MDSPWICLQDRDLHEKFRSRQWASAQGFEPKFSRMGSANHDVAICGSLWPDVVFPQRKSRKKRTKYSTSRSLLAACLSVRFHWVTRRYVHVLGDTAPRSHSCKTLKSNRVIVSIKLSPQQAESAHRWRWGCQPYTPADLYPQEDSTY